MKKKLVLKKTPKKVLFTLILFLIDLVVYYFLKSLGIYAGENNLIDTFLITGWIWLTIGTVVSLSICWDVA